MIEVVAICVHVNAAVNNDIHKVFPLDRYLILNFLKAVDRVLNVIVVCIFG